MKNIVFYANCQYGGFQYFLEKIFPDAEFHILMNYEIIKYKEDLRVDLLESADLFIYQPIKKEHGIYSTENILKYIKEDCIKISFPYIFNSGTCGVVAEIDSMIGEWKDSKTFNECIEIMREKEKTTDISVSDFIVKNASKKLFMTQNHPTSPIYVECINQLMKILGRPERFNHFEYEDNIMKPFMKM